jgi:hypothetical protein
MISVGLIELPAFKLLDEAGLNWTALRQREPLGSKQILTAQLMAAGFDAQLVNLKAADAETELGTVDWSGRRLRKIAVGMPWQALRPRDFDIWGLTVNYMQERDIACDIIRYLSQGGGRVIVGGSDVFAEPETFLRADPEKSWQGITAFDG